MDSERKLKEFFGENFFSEDLDIFVFWTWVLPFIMIYPPNLFMILQLTLGMIIGTEFWKIFTIFLIILCIFGIIIPYILGNKYYRHKYQGKMYPNMKKYYMKCSLCLIFTPACFMVMYIPLNFYEIMIYILVISTFLPIGILKKSYLKQIRIYMDNCKIMESSDLQYLKDLYTFFLSNILIFPTVMLLLSLKIYPIYGFLLLHTFVLFEALFKNIKTEKRLIKIFKSIGLPLFILMGIFCALAVIIADLVPDWVP